MTITAPTSDQVVEIENDIEWGEFGWEQTGDAANLEFDATVCHGCGGYCGPFLYEDEKGSGGGAWREVFIDAGWRLWCEDCVCTADADAKLTGGPA